MQNNDFLKTRIYEEYSEKLYGYFMGKTQDPSLSDELRSEVFLKAVAGMDSFDSSKASLSTWIYHIAQNTLFDYFRAKKVTENIDDQPDMADTADIPEDELCRSETLEELADALEALDKRLRDIILLHYYDGCTLREIGERMGISYNYVKILHKDALQRLKEKLNY